MWLWLLLLDEGVMVPQLSAGPIFQVEAVEESDDDHDDGEDQSLEQLPY